MISVKLVKVESTHNNIRSNETEGKTTHLPEVGNSFVLFSPPLEAGDIRVIRTTPIVSVEHIDNKYTFKTQNSTYELTILSDKDVSEYERV